MSDPAGPRRGDQACLELARCLNRRVDGTGVGLRRLACQSGVRPGGGASPRRSALRADCPAVLAPVARRRTRCVRLRLTALAQRRRISSRGALTRAATRAAFLGASEARRRAGARRFATPTSTSMAGGAFVCHRRWPSRQAAPAAGDLCGGEQRRTGVGARSALRELTRGRRSSAATAGSVASSAARPRAEQHSEVGPQGRPPQGEPAAGAACRDAPTGAVPAAPHETFAVVANGPQIVGRPSTETV